MKIAVFFGSFNPMTNAHLAIMKSAVEHLNADQGQVLCPARSRFPVRCDHGCRADTTSKPRKCSSSVKTDFGLSWQTNKKQS